MHSDEFEPEQAGAAEEQPNPAADDAPEAAEAAEAADAAELVDRISATADATAEAENGASTLDAPGVPAVSDAIAERARELCAHLLIFRYLPKRAHRDLLLDDTLRDEVKRRLDDVGLELAESYGSDHFGVRLSPAIESDMSFDWPLNVRLPRGAVALLVVLWAKLVLPRRIGDDGLTDDVGTGGVEGEADDTAGADRQADRADDAQPAAVATEPSQPAREPPPPVTRDALYAEFGRKFGKTAFARYLGQLKNAHLVVEEHGGIIREGPLLDLLVDGEQMAHKLRDSVLWDVLDRGEDAEAPLPGLEDDELDPIDAPASDDEG